MHNFFVKSEHRKTIHKILGFTVTLGNARIGIINEKQLKRLVNMNVDINECCYKVPHSYKVGDYITCLDEPSFDFSDFNDHSSRIQRTGCAWEKGRTFPIHQIKGGGGTLFDKDSGGLYLNWVRPATEEEIEKYLVEEKNKKEEDDILNFW